MEREDELTFRPGFHSSLHNRMSVSDERRNEQMNGQQRALTAPPANAASDTADMLTRHNKRILSLTVPCVSRQ